MAWQTINDECVPVQMYYQLGADGSVGFAMGTYNARMVRKVHLHWMNGIGPQSFRTPFGLIVQLYP